MTQISNESINFVLFPSQFSGEHQQTKKKTEKKVNTRLRLAIVQCARQLAMESNLMGIMNFEWMIDNAALANRSKLNSYK